MSLSKPDLSLKREIHTACLHFVSQRIAAAQEAMKDAQEAANMEAKSSSGDKYEVGRSMMQLESEKNAVHLNHALQLKNALEKINPELTTDRVGTGSLVFTNRGTYYISVSAGKLTLEQGEVYAISPATPLALALKGKVEGEKTKFRDLDYKVKHII